MNWENKYLIKSGNITQILHSLLGLLIIFCCFPGFSQNPDREYQSHKFSGDTVFVNVSDGKYIFVPYTSEIIETSFIPPGEKRDTVSHAVILKPQNPEFTVSEEETFLKIDSEGIDVLVTKSPFKISYFFNEEEIISEKSGYTKNDSLEKIDFNLKEAEMLFGGGARALGMDRRGNRLELYNKAHFGYEERAEQLNYSLPIVLSSEKYLLHFDNAPKGFLDLDSKKSNTLAYETISGRKTYQLVVGETWEEILENYTLLTGRQPMPPRWAFGNFASRFGYHSQKEVEETIEKFRNDSIPVDAVILDLYWFGHEIKGTMGNLEFVKDSFPEPEQMISNLKQKGIQTILVTEPFILTTSKKWKEAVEKEVLATNAAGKPFTFDFYFGNSGLIDIFKPEAQDWFWNIYKDLTEMGISGFWGDLGEPEAHPAELQHVIGAADEVHNIYGHYWAKLIYEGFENDFSDKRPFILMRAGAAGSQRFGLIPWSGDVSRSWGGLKPQPEISLQMGLQGLAYMHSDLGGFAGSVQDDELYIRWLQYGVFQPIFRPHAQEEIASEPVYKDPETKELAKQAIELRYKLLPYNYTLAFQNSQTGIPLMRPLFFEEPENPELYQMAHTYLWGNDILVSMISEAGIKEKEIYIPAGSNWIDFYTGKTFKGGTKILVPVEKEYIPTFIRGGAFIPKADLVQTTANYDASTLDVHYYYDPQAIESSGLLYHDDGLTPEAYQKGIYEIVKFQSKLEPGAINLLIEKEEGENSTSEIQLLRIHIENLKVPVKFLWLNGIKYTGKNYMHQEKLDIPVSFYQEQTTIKIEFE